jgi:hypothetical protein
MAIFLVPQSGPAIPVLADGAKANTQDLRDGAKALTDLFRRKFCTETRLYAIL